MFKIKSTFLAATSLLITNLVQAQNPPFNLELMTRYENAISYSRIPNAKYVYDTMASSDIDGQIVQVSAPVFHIKGKNLWLVIDNLATKNQDLFRARLYNKKPPQTTRPNPNSWDMQKYYKFFGAAFVFNDGTPSKIIKISSGRKLTKQERTLQEFISGYLSKILGQMVEKIRKPSFQKNFNRQDTGASKALSI